MLTTLAAAPTSAWGPQGWTWEQWTVAGLSPLVALIGVALTAVTLPGTWLIAAAAIAVRILRPEMLSWWPIAVLLVLALLGELLEFVAGALGARKAGASRTGAIGAVVGALVGALAGAPVLFPVGSIVGGAVGSGAGAVLGEHMQTRKTWKESARIAGGAAAGRLLATVAKTLIAALMGVVFCLAVLF
ncbi:MAG TPA: DUF456 domain-containing protein [Phycisphaerales bacterium]|nr:DUF456 domain-containing protein [Phycisphaerales bacterium]